MKHNLKSILILFQVTGMSIKDLNCANAIKKNCVSILSMMISLISMSYIAYFFIDQLIINIEARKKTLINFSFLYVTIVAFVNLVTTIKNRKLEARFWKTIKTNGAKITEDSEKANRRIVMLLAPFWLLSVIKLVAIFGGKYVLGLNLPLPVIRVTVSVFFYRLLLLKFVYYVEVLAFRLKSIEKRMQKKIFSIKECREFKKDFDTCWRMCKLIEDIFGLSMMLTWGNTLNGALVSTYLSYLDLSNGFQNSFNFISSIWISVDILIVIVACENCLSAFNAIKISILNKSRISCESFEGFLLKICHQRIKMAPKNIFELNRIVLVSVSISE